MSFGWCQVDEALFAISLPGRDCARYQLIAERLPKRKGWDWTVWRIGDALDAVRYGDAASAAAAMRAAEGAMHRWEETTEHDPSADRLCS